MKDVPPPPETDSHPTIDGQTVVEVIYSPRHEVRGIITVDSTGTYQVRTEYWNVRHWEDERVAFWNQGLLGTRTDTLDNARVLCRERLAETHPPKEYPSDELPSAVRKLIDELLPALVHSDHPGLAALREQLPGLKVKRVESTLFGLFADFGVDEGAPRATPLNFAGGDAEIRLAGVVHPAGCTLFVRNGRLATLDVYTKGNEPWPDNPVVESIDCVVPICPAR
jgi:hypothetical protein